MARSIYDAHWVIDAIAIISEKEEDKYDEIPGWDGEFTADSPKAVLLWLPRATTRKEREVWFPVNQLRRTGDGLTVYASKWILEQKGFK